LSGDLKKLQVNWHRQSKLLRSTGISEKPATDYVLIRFKPHLPSSGKQFRITVLGNSY